MNNFLAACRRQPHDHVPVWFMRQAGRALPEYRALRGEGSILDAIRRPDLAAELTLQPVHRYGVDAAVLYSDIVVPVAAIGFGVDIAPGTGPVVAEPFRSTRRSRRACGRSTPSATRRTCSRRSQKVSAELPDDVPLIGFAGAPFTVASYLVEGQPVAHLREDQGAHARRPERCGTTCSTGWPTSPSRRCDRRSSTARAPSSSSTAGPAHSSPAHYERFVLPASTKVFAAIADLDVPRIHFGVDTGELLELFAAAGADVVGVDWRTSIAAARARTGWHHGVAGQPRPGCMLRAVAGGRGGGPHCAGRQRRPPRSRLQSRPRRAARHRPGGARARRRARPPRRESYDRREHGRGGDGVRHARVDSTTSPPTTRTSGAAGRRPTSSWPTSAAATTRSAACRRCARSPKRSALASVPRSARASTSTLGYKHAAPFIEDAVAELRDDPDVTDVVGVVLAPHDSRGSVGEYVDRLGPGAKAVRSVAHVPAWRTFQAEAIRDGAAFACRRGTRVVFTAHSLPERVLEGDVYEDELEASAAASRSSAHSATRTGRSPGSRPGGRRSRGGVRTSATCSTPLPPIPRCDGVVVCPQGFTADHLEVLYDLDIAAKEHADELGLAFARTRMVNDDAEVLAALAAEVRALSS